MHGVDSDLHAAEDSKDMLHFFKERKVKVQVPRVVLLFPFAHSLVTSAAHVDTFRHHQSVRRQNFVRRRHAAVEPRDRIGLVGPNGAGKSTLFSIILGEESPDDGKIMTERDVDIGYLPQESAPAGDETVIEIATAITPEFVKTAPNHQGVGTRSSRRSARIPRTSTTTFTTDINELNGYQLEAKAKQILAGLSFRETDFDRPAREMSGGWVMRAHLARLLVQEPDLLMLDEPTNHLDLEALLWFQEYLQELSRRDSRHLARPRISESARRQHRGDPP